MNFVWGIWSVKDNEKTLPLQGFLIKFPCKFEVVWWPMYIYNQMAQVATAVGPVVKKRLKWMSLSAWKSTDHVNGVFCEQIRKPYNHKHGIRTSPRMAIVSKTGSYTLVTFAATNLTRALGLFIPSCKRREQRQAEDVVRLTVQCELASRPYVCYLSPADCLVLCLFIQPRQRISVWFVV